VKLLAREPRGGKPSVLSLRSPGSQADSRSPAGRMVIFICSIATTEWKYKSSTNSIEEWLDSKPGMMKHQREWNILLLVFQLFEHYESLHTAMYGVIS
jgi:hypothetical protein